MSNEPKYSSREERDRAKREQRKKSGKVSRAEYARQNSLWLEEKSHISLHDIRPWSNRTARYYLHQTIIPDFRIHRRIILSV